jgi:hypothetical protein
MVDAASAVAPSGNRYKTIFVIAKARYIMIFLHKNKDTATFEEILLKAIAQAGQKTKILRTDGALEYLNMGVAATLLKLGSFNQTTNPHHQQKVSPKPRLARANLSRLAGASMPRLETVLLQASVRTILPRLAEAILPALVGATLSCLAGATLSRLAGAILPRLLREILPILAGALLPRLASPNQAAALWLLK